MNIRLWIGLTLGFYTKKSPLICNPCIIWKPFGTKLMIDCNKEPFFLDSHIFCRSWARSRMNWYPIYIPSTYSTNSEQLEKGTFDFKEQFFGDQKVTYYQVWDCVFFLERFCYSIFGD